MDIYSNYENRIRNMLEDEYEKEPQLITLSQEADAMIENFADELEPMLKAACRYIWLGRKACRNVLRIAGLLCRASVYRCHDFWQMLRSWL